MKQSIRIVSDGTAAGTKVLTATGEKIDGVMRIEIEAIEPRGLVTATVTFLSVSLDVVANVEAP